MRDCTRYTINAALHVVTCILQDAMIGLNMSMTERLSAEQTVKVIAQLRDEWSKAPDMARRNG